MTMLLNADEARRRVAAGARIVDIRSPEEFAREHMPGSVNLPAELLETQPLPSGALIFTCRSGGRTGQCAARIAAAAGPDAAILDGGLNAWRAAGGPVSIDRSKPIDIMRQVQIAAGLLILTGLFLAALFDPAFLGLVAFVGAGLLFAGVSGWCGMARLLGIMPWNRAAR